MLKAIQNVFFLGYSGGATWFCYLTPSWPGFHTPHPLPTPPHDQLVSGCGAEERGLHNTQQERDRLWQQGPQRSNPAAVKGILWHVPTPPLTKSQVILEKLQDQLADLCRCSECRQHSLQHKGGTRSS